MSLIEKFSVFTVLPV